MGLTASTAIHIYCFNLLRPLASGANRTAKGKAARLAAACFKLEELPLLGVFALDSPTRPNPIGLTLVRLLRSEGNWIAVSGLDFFDGTPILDIKPYRGQYRTDEFTVPDWFRKLAEPPGSISQVRSVFFSCSRIR
jgi:tRNA (Thr-GGU) A37 N-methylase